MFLLINKTSKHNKSYLTETKIAISVRRAPFETAKTPNSGHVNDKAILHLHLKDIRM